MITPKGPTPGRAAKLLATCEIDVDAINVSERMRPVSDSAVTSLMESIKDQGLLSEIHVRKIRHRENRLFLIAGGHRIEAYRRLNMHKIPCKIWDCTDDWAALTEIDENLAHKNLAPLELAVFLRDRKAAYERMYPETKATTGAALAAKRWDATDKLSVASFVTSTAEQMGQSERNVERIISAATRLSAEQIEVLYKAPRSVSILDLQTIAKLTSSDDQDAVCIALSEGKAKSAAEAMSQRNARPGDAIRSAADKQLVKLNDAFARASMAARRQFVATHGDTLRALLETSPDTGDINPDAAPQFTPRKRTN